MISKDWEFGSTDGVQKPIKLIYDVAEGFMQALRMVDCEPNELSFNEAESFTG